VRTGASGFFATRRFSLPDRTDQEGVLVRNRCAGWLQIKYSNLINTLISMAGSASRSGTPIMTKCTLRGHLRAAMEQECFAVVGNAQF
jgi:hypothetical protein